MAEEVKMPQMGESIAEGTIVKWLKQVGDAVKRDEPLFEISTDKVDAEIPAPASGVLSEIKVQEGETVPINTVVAVINGAGAQPAAPKPEQEAAPAASTPAAPPVQTAPPAAAEQKAVPLAQPPADTQAEAAATSRQGDQQGAAPSATPPSAEAAAPDSVEELRRVR